MNSFWNPARVQAKYRQKNDLSHLYTVHLGREEAPNIDQKKVLLQHGTWILPPPALLDSYGLRGPWRLGMRRSSDDFGQPPSAA